jgi:hypothetical protein
MKNRGLIEIPMERMGTYIREGYHLIPHPRRVVRLYIYLCYGVDV